MTIKTLIAVGTAVLLGAAASAAAGTRQMQPAGQLTGVRAVEIPYRTHAGATSRATVLLPSWYGPDRNPPLPLVISPHGRGLTGEINARLWGELPTTGGFAVVNPDGRGDHLSGRFSWGAPGEIDDLARMPEIVAHALPWVKLDPHRVYAVGGSMGGQETLLLLGRHPKLLAGAVAVDPLVDFARQYRNFATFECDAACVARWGEPIGEALQSLARREVGGAPSDVPERFAQRNVLTYARSIAGSGVPLQIWWSRADRVIVDSKLHSGALVKKIRRLEAHAPLTVRTGTWNHTHPLRWDRQLPVMLAGLGLLDDSVR